MSLAAHHFGVGLAPSIKIILASLRKMGNSSQAPQTLPFCYSAHLFLD